MYNGQVQLLNRFLLFIFSIMKESAVNHIDELGKSPFSWSIIDKEIRTQVIPSGVLNRFFS